MDGLWTAVGQCLRELRVLTSFRAVLMVAIVRGLRLN